MTMASLTRRRTVSTWTMTTETRDGLLRLRHRLPPCMRRWHTNWRAEHIGCVVGDNECADKGDRNAWWLLAALVTHCVEIISYPFEAALVDVPSFFHILFSPALSYFLVSTLSTSFLFTDSTICLYHISTSGARIEARQAWPKREAPRPTALLRMSSEFVQLLI